MTEKTDPQPLTDEEEKWLYHLLKPAAAAWIQCDHCGLHHLRKDIRNSMTFNYCRKCMPKLFKERTK